MNLWLLTGRTPVLHQIPVSVLDKGKGYDLEVTPAISLLKIQQQVMDSALTPCGHKDSDCWRVKRREFQQIATKAAYDCDPELYLIWERPRPDNRKDSEKIKAAARDEFCAWCYARGLGESEEHFQYLFSQLKKLMAEWLINTEKPIDLGFIRLHNLPYRPEWKLVLDWNFSVLSASGWREYRAENPSHRLLKRGMLRGFLSLDLLAFSRFYGICLRHIDVEHMPEWYKMMRIAERERLSKLGRLNYAKEFMRSVKRSLDASISIFARWRTDTSYPSAGCVGGDQSGRFYFVPQSRDRLLYYKALDWDAVADVVFTQWPPFTKSGGKEIVPPADVKLPAMLDVQREEADLRDSGGSVPESTDKKT